MLSELTNWQDMIGTVVNADKENHGNDISQTKVFRSKIIHRKNG